MKCLMILLALLLFVQSDERLQDLPTILLPRTEQVPHVNIGWQTADGKAVSLAKSLAYSSDLDREDMGANIAGYVAMGGARLTKGAGHPRGAVVRVGFYKVDMNRQFFERIAAEGTVRVELRGVFMNQPAKPRQGSVVQHLKFSLDALKSCQMPSDAWSLYNTTLESDTLAGRVRPGIDARLGVLGGKTNSEGRTELTVEDDGSITMRAMIPYALFKHVLDPWKRAIPGTFLEPMHFHVEYEVLPEDVALELESRLADPLPND